MTDVRLRLGSCAPTPDEVFETPGLAEALDEITMVCEECGWWCEVSDLDDEQKCRECKDG